MMYSQDGRELWVVHYQVRAGEDWEAIDGRAVIRAMLGADVEFEIISGGPWTGGLALVAEHYQSGPVFLAGDAAHLFTPLGGLGMNTGIGDVMNLCWKLAADHQGWAGPSLIGSYEVERLPIGHRNSLLGVRCTKVMDGWVLPENFENDTADAEQMRRAFGARVIEDDRPQYLTVGTAARRALRKLAHRVPRRQPEPARHLGQLHAARPARRSRAARLARTRTRAVR